MRNWLRGENVIQPKISIIVPVYNAEKYIEETIENLKQQTFKKYEIIFVLGYLYKKAHLSHCLFGYNSCAGKSAASISGFLDLIYNIVIECTTRKYFYNHFRSDNLLVKIFSRKKERTSDLSIYAGIPK